MAEIAGRINSGFRYAGLIVLGLLGILLLPFLAVGTRLILMLAAILWLIVGLVVSRFSPRFREWFEATAFADDQVGYKGLRWDTHLLAHPSHSWARIRGRSAVVGVDDLMESTLGPVEVVELPVVGTHVERGDRLFRLRRADRVIEARAPVSGTVRATNEALREHPELVNHDPFSTGWVVRIQGDRVRDEEKSLLQGREALAWFRQETDRLLTSILHQDSLAPAMADGGEFVEHLYRDIDDDAWKRLTETFFQMTPER
jgi:glycine cleavage system H protein